jgi:hypothetical protein
MVLCIDKVDVAYFYLSSMLGKITLNPLNYNIMNM